MNRNLITRMGTATGVVAALVATVFVVLVTAVRDQREATDRAVHSERVIDVARDLQLAVVQVDLGEDHARAQIPGLLDNLQELVAAEPGQRRRVAAIGREVAVLAPRGSGPADAAEVRRAIEQVITAERRTADAGREEAASKADQAVALGIGGLIGSAVLIALLTTYLTRYIVVPVRRTVKAARRLSLGDLSARVVEEGDAEPVELAQAFNLMAASLQESERLKDEFFALVSHELRTPLTSIIGYLELVLDDEEELSPDARRFLEVVERNAKRLLRLVGDMLFVAQVEAGRLSLERGPVDLGSVAAEAVEAARPAAERRRVALTLDAEEVATLQGDRDRFGQMLDNLISNALKFTEEDGSVRVRLTDTGAGARVEVADDGMGIPDAEQKRLFERFFRSSTATSRAVPGAGLGLTIVKTIVEAHGGAVSLASTEGEGTTVTVELPYARVEAPA